MLHHIVCVVCFYNVEEILKYVLKQKMVFKILRWTASLRTIVKDEHWSEYNASEKCYILDIMRRSQETGLFVHKRRIVIIANRVEQQETE